MPVAVFLVENSDPVVEELVGQERVARTRRSEVGRRFLLAQEPATRTRAWSV
jgi:hypothetical protein